MAKTIQCERCRKKYKFDNKLAGKTVSCPNCQLPLSIPGERWVEPAIEGVPPVPPQKPTVNADEDRPVFHEAPQVNFWHVLRAAWPEYRGLWIAGLVFILSVVGWILTPKVLLFEAILVAGVVFGIVRMCIDGWKNKLLAHRLSIAVCCLAGLLYFFRITDNEVRRFDEGHLSDRDFVVHRFRRWNHKWLSGEGWFHAGGLLHGPITETGKWHGEWEHSFWHQDRYLVSRSWYWYGDEISEGEWVLRNK